MARITQERLAAIKDVALHGLEPGCRNPRNHNQPCQCKTKNPLSNGALDMIAELECWRRFALLFEISRQARNRVESMELMQEAIEFAAGHELFRDL